MEPLGNWHLDYVWGVLIATLMNCHKTKGPPIRPEDLFPTLASGRQRQGMSPEEQAARWRMAAVATSRR